MAKTNNRKRSLGTSSGAALAAVMLSAPGLAAQAAAPVAKADKAPSDTSQRSTNYEKHSSDASAKTYIKFQTELKHKDDYTVAGAGDGHIVFEDPRGNLFYLDEATGDQKFVSRAIFIKMTRQTISKDAIKLSGKVRILGVDQAGRAIMSNSRGEQFTLDPATGDMIFSK